MAMHDWNNYRSQIVAGVGEIGKLSPDTVKGYMTLGSAGHYNKLLPGFFNEIDPEQTS